MQLHHQVDSPHRRHSWWSLAWVVFLASILALGGTAAWLTLDPTSPLSGMSSEAAHPFDVDINITHAWVIQGWVNESYALIAVDGSVTIDAGGHLDISNSTLTMDESSNLEFGVTVESGGSLLLSNTVVESSPSSDHTYVIAYAGATLRIVGGTIEDIGGNDGAEQGLFIGAAYASVSGTTFTNYYEAIVVSSAADVHVTGVVILNSTSYSNETYAVYVYGASSGFVLSGSTLDIPQSTGALWVSSPNAEISNNVFTLDAQENALSGLFFGYMDNGAETATGSSFDNNTVTGSGFIDEAASYVTIWGNTIHDTGPARPYGILAEVPLWTDTGLWVSHLTIAWNAISDYSRYGVRLQQNVTDFTVDHNSIVQPSATPGPASTEQWGGPRIDALYLIRGVTDGTVAYNYIDDTDAWYVATDGITLESDVSHVQLIDNEFYNVSQEGVVMQGNVPGFDNALPWQNGPSLYDTIANNLFDNERAVTETNFTVEGILIWQWANHTTVANNTFIGWENVPTVKDYFNGAAVLTTGSYGVFTNNTVDGARYGFVFSNFTGVTHPYSGEFNRSYNLVYGNVLTGITVAAVAETPTDGMGPLHDVVVVLSNPSTGPGIPTSFVQSIGSAQALSATESGGTYAVTLRTTSPITGIAQNFTTSLLWSNDKFSITAAGGVGWGIVSLAPTSVSPMSVETTITATNAETVAIDLYPTDGPYSALYNVSSTLNGVTTDYLATAHGAITVAVAAGETSLKVELVSFVSIGPTLYTLSGVVSQTNNSTAILGAAVQVSGGPSTTSNATGFYQLQLSNATYFLTVGAGGLEPESASVTIVGSNQVQNFSLASQVYPVSGTVVSAANQTVLIGANVTSSGGASGSTNSSGSYSLALTNGTYLLTVSAWGFAPSTAPVWVDGANTSENFSLTPEFYNVSGSVQSSGNESPIAGAVVSLPSGESAVSNVSGDYNLPVGNGTFLLLVSAVGYVSANVTVSISGSSAMVNVSLNATVGVVPPVVPPPTSVPPSPAAPAPVTQPASVSLTADYGVALGLTALATALFALYLGAMALNSHVSGAGRNGKYGRTWCASRLTMTIHRVQLLARHLHPQTRGRTIRRVRIIG